MSGKLSTHVLDTAAGKPAAGMTGELWRHGQEAGDGRPERLKVFTLNADGRADGALLEGDEFVAGNYHLIFHVARYYQAQGNPDAGKFLDQVPLVFVVKDSSQKFHVPLLVSPWSYSTYRGS